MKVLCHQSFHLQIEERFSMATNDNLWHVLFMISYVYYVHVGRNACDL